MPLQTCMQYRNMTSMHRINSRVHERREHHCLCRLFKERCLNYSRGCIPELITNYYYTNCRNINFCRVSIKSPHAHRKALVFLKAKLLSDVETSCGRIAHRVDCKLDCAMRDRFWSHHPQPQGQETVCSNKQTKKKLYYKLTKHVDASRPNIADV